MSKYPICIYCKKEQVGKKFQSKNLSRITCVDCARKKRDIAHKAFLECLIPEQRTLFFDYEEWEGYFISMLIVDKRR